MAMPNPFSPSENHDSLTGDPRWSLVERIVASPSFAKSDRLCKFLLYICELSLQGREDEISEVNIGATLFGRSNYDPSVDGIVRSHASRMRQRLEKYFSLEGSDEQILLTIPKGAYVPVFEHRLPVADHQEASISEAAIASTATTPGLDVRVDVKGTRWMPRILGTALLLLCVTIAYLLFLLQNRAIPSSPLDAHPLWGSFFGSGHEAMVVCSDTSLAVLQDETEHEVYLSDYLNANYRMNIPSSRGATMGVLRDLAARRYTAIADVGILTRFYQLPGIHPDRIHFRYARDVVPDDLKTGAAILIGSKYSDPWVGLFESHMNFVFQDDPQQRISSIVDRSPQPGEEPRYDYSQSDGSPRIFGVVALRPNLRGTRKILILEGTSMAGTEAAADFAFDNGLLLPFLAKIKTQDGGIPYFEVLIESSNVNGSASQIRILGYRTSAN